MTWILRTTPEPPEGGDVMSEHTEQAAKKQADKIREQLQNASLYGEKIDQNNIDQMIVAAFCIGESKERERGWGRLVPEVDLA